MAKKYSLLHAHEQNDDGDARQHAPATTRNRDFILDVLQNELPEKGNILEIASGSGEHAVYLAPKLFTSRAQRVWQASDPAEDRQASIQAWAQHTGTKHLLPPVFIDTTDPKWVVEGEDYPHNFSAILCINMIHIAPWDACVGLMAGAGRILPSGGCLYLYGPFMVDGEHTSDSNAAFNDRLQAKDPTWGIRDVGDVAKVAEGNGLTHTATHQMPANNLSLVFRKS